MDIFKGKIDTVGDLIFINDKEVGLKQFEDWFSDILGAISDNHKAIEVRLKER